MLNLQQKSATFNCFKIFFCYKSANEKKISIKDLTTEINNKFQEDCNYLICEKPSFQPKATENIKEMIEMISILVKKGFAYESENHIYFEVDKFKDYGKLSNKKIDDLISGSRVEVSSNKRNALFEMFFRCSL